MGRNLIAGLLFTVFANFACSTPQGQNAVIHSDRREPSQVVSRAECSKPLQAQVRIVQSTEAKSYLNNLGRFLISVIAKNQPAIYAAISESKLQVNLIAGGLDRLTGYSLSAVSGGSPQVYLSVELLKKLEYENELVALMAVEILQGYSKKLNCASPVDQMQASLGLSSHSGDPLDREAFRSAVQILYNSGYDSRGLISLIQIFEKNRLSLSLDEGFIENLKGEVRREIAIYPPLRNPIIQSNQFLTFQKRVRRL